MAIERSITRTVTVSETEGLSRAQRYKSVPTRVQKRVQKRVLQKGKGIPVPAQTLKASSVVLIRKIRGANRRYWARKNLDHNSKYRHLVPIGQKECWLLGALLAKDKNIPWPDAFNIVTEIAWPNA